MSPRQKPSLNFDIMVILCWYISSELIVTDRDNQKENRTKEKKNHKIYKHLSFRNPVWKESVTILISPNHANFILIYRPSHTAANFILVVKTKISDPKERALVNDKKEVNSISLHSQLKSESIDKSCTNCFWLR